MKKADEIAELELRAEQIGHYMNGPYRDGIGPGGSDREQLDKINERLEELRQPSATGNAFKTAAAAIVSSISGLFRNKSNDRFQERLAKIAADNPDHNHHDM